jgi:RIO kinase 1
MVYAWTQKEFKNLQRLKQIKVGAPRPIIYSKNVLIMEYLGTKNRPAPLMKDVKLENPKETYHTLIDYISRMYKKAELVHADISAFNVLMYKKKPYLIDLGQGVLLEHLNALEFLKRDIHNIVSYFRKYNIKEDERKIYKNITGKQW